MNLNDYPTPETDAFGETPMPTLEHSGYADYVTAINHWIDHARDLERRLALCRDALNELHYYCTASDFNEHWYSYKNAEEALSATAPK